MQTYEGRTARGGFTLIEVLVVVAIIVVLIAILVPSLSKAMEVAQKAKCLAQEKGIYNGISTYRPENKNRLSKRVNGGRWKPYNQGDLIEPVQSGVEGSSGGDVEGGANEGYRHGAEGAYGSYIDEGDFGGNGQWIRPNHGAAYWGVAYIENAGNNREIFQCPNSTGADNYYVDFKDHEQSTDKWTIFESFNTYGFNGAESGNPFFGGNYSSPHYEDDGSGAQMSRDKTPSTTMVFMDAWESMLDSNGDLPPKIDSNQFQYGSYPIQQYWRHEGWNNFQFNDGHAESVTPTPEELAQTSTTERRYPSLHWSMFFQAE